MDHIKDTILKTAENVVVEKKNKRNEEEWYNEECQDTIEVKRKSRL